MTSFDKSDDSGDSDYEPSKYDKANISMKRIRVTTGAPAKHTMAGATSLPTPGLTPTDPAFGAQFAAFEEQQQDQSVAPPTQYAAPLQTHLPSLLSPQSPLEVQVPEVPFTPPFQLNGMLRFEDEVLAGLLSFSRRGAEGHCTRDTADLWLYILRLFFPTEEGYDITLTNYHEQSSSDSPSSDSDTDVPLIPSGTPVTIQVWKTTLHYHPLYRHFTSTSSTPLLTMLCGSSEDRFTEYPAVRHAKPGATSMDVPVTTALQRALYGELCEKMKMHAESVAGGRNQAALMKGVSGGVACGSMVRFFKVNGGGDAKSVGKLKAWSARGLDLVNGVPSEALGSVERVLLRIKGSNKKGKT